MPNKTKPKLSKIKQMPSKGWVKTKDRLPKKHGLYLAYSQNSKSYSIEPFGPDDWAGKAVWLNYIPYWMPLPEPPKCK